MPCPIGSTTGSCQGAVRTEKTPSRDTGTSSAHPDTTRFESSRLSVSLEPKLRPRRGLKSWGCEVSPSTGNTTTNLWSKLSVLLSQVHLENNLRQTMDFFMVQKKTLGGSAVPLQCVLHHIDFVWKWCTQKIKKELSSFSLSNCHLIGILYTPRL